ncbi:MAG: Mrp/NBP35 family ATP-binding protein [Pseudomonadota bacterium]
MFKTGEKHRKVIGDAVRDALGAPDRLEAVTVSADGRATLVIQADPNDLAGSEQRRIEAEVAARKVKGVKDANAVLTAEKIAGPAPGAKRVQKGDGLAAQSLATPKSASPSPIQKPDHGGRLIAVASAKGGVGKSTVAVNLAVALAASGKRVGLLDADVYGPSLPTMLGTLDANPKQNAAGKIIPVEAHGLKSMSIGYVADADAPMIWRGAMVMSALTQLLNDVAWGSPEDPLDYLILDTPPGTGDAQLTLAQRAPLTAAILVTTPQEAALADVRRGAAMFAKTEVPVLGVVETMSWFEDPSGQRHALFGDGGGARMAAALGLPLLAQLPILPAIREGGDTGAPAALTDPAARNLFDRLAANVAQSVEDLETKPPPEIVFED